MGAAKATQNVFYDSEKAQCEAEKASQNGIFAAQKAACETGKSSGKAACEIDKAASTQLCQVSNVFSGDILGPSAINLFRRSLDLDPLVPTADDLKMAIVHGGLEGESELLIGSHLRVGKSFADRDDVGDDLNHIVELLMSRLRHASLISDEAIRVFAQQRQPSYGSYLRAYYSQFGDDATDIKGRINAGISSGWAPDVSPVYGAIRWYHRADVGANPQLATLYSIIVDKFFH